MSLTAGTTLGLYEIVAPLGAGGMGEVYLARDTKLDREVAIKVLPETMTRDKERVARFEREAKVLASLNHPNIAAIYGFETADGKALLIMELAEGETLAECLSRGLIPVDEVLQIAKQIAEALEAAHDKGIIHRDLKPANIKVSPDGKVKVLDFGLAKAMSGGDESSQYEIANSPTITADFTRPGVILGTAAYMSPEQARGKPLDKRTDIWSFGCLLFELLTGQRLFGGETTSDVIGSILNKEPDWTTLPPATPPTVHLLLRRSLTRDRHQRLRDIGDARIELHNAIADPTSSSLGLAASAIELDAKPARRSAKALALPWALVVILAIALGWLFTRVPEQIDTRPRPVRRLTIPVSAYAPRFGGIAVSPGGEHIVYRGDRTESNWRLFIRRLDSFDDRPLGGSDGGYAPFISPDGRQIGFFSSGYLFRVAARGGAAERICPAFGFETGTWGPQDTIIFSSSRAGDGENQGLSQVSASGQDVRILTTIDSSQGERAHFAPSYLPDGKSILFSIDRGVSKSVAILSLETLEYKALLENAEGAYYIPTGHILYYGDVEDRIFAAAFDLESRQVSRERIRVVDTPVSSGFSVSQEGTLAYYSLDADTTGTQTVVWADRRGVVTPLIAERGAWADPRLSPTGDRLILRKVGSPDCHLWTYDLSRSALTRLTFEGDNHNPVWEADGQTALVGVELDAIRALYEIPVDGSSAPKRLTEGEGEQVPGRGSDDGTLLVFEETSIRTGNDIWVLDREYGGTKKPFVQTSFDESYPASAPNRKWIAYTSDESGREEVYVRPYPGPGAKTQVSTDGGTGALWSRDGKELFFSRDDAMMKVDVLSESPLAVSPPVKLFEGEFAWGRTLNYDIAPDGERFVMIKPAAGGNGSQELRVVLNFFDVVRATFSAGAKE